MIIDVHTHWGTVWEDKYGTDPAGWLRVCDRHGVDCAALMGHRGLILNGDDEIRRCNDIIRKTCDRSDGRLIPLATVHPVSGDTCLRELERCIKDLDMRGLKLHPWVQGFSTAGPVMDDLARMCGSLDVPVIFHDGTPCYSMPSQIGGLALRFPGTKFVLGHAGLLELWRSALSFARRCPNLYVTLCGPHLAGVQAVLDNVDEDRIMWGTDFGFGWADPIEYRKALIDCAVMTEGKRCKVMGDNAVKLFRWGR
ncbi:amidohydrolase [bacterium]|nr:amidohydrolase [bacterium]